MTPPATPHRAPILFLPHGGGPLPLLGDSFHNLHSYFSPAMHDAAQCVEFDEWLGEACSGNELSGEERERRLQNWESGPHARFCHPRQEHLLPLHVCFRAASARVSQAERVFNGDMMGKRVSAFLWG